MFRTKPLLVLRAETRTKNLLHVLCDCCVSRILSSFSWDPIAFIFCKPCEVVKDSNALPDELNLKHLITGYKSVALFWQDFKNYSNLHLHFQFDFSE